MIRERQITFRDYRKMTAFVKSIVVLFLVILFFQQEALFAQVISNTGAAMSVANGIVVVSKDFENNTGSLLGNNGTITLSGNYTNFSLASTNGNGFYNLMGNWTNNGLFTAGTSTVTFNGVANQFINHGSSGETFYILNINNPGRIVTQLSSAGGTLTVLNNLNI